MCSGKSFVFGLQAWDSPDPLKVSSQTQFSTTPTEGIISRQSLVNSHLLLAFIAFSRHTSACASPPRDAAPVSTMSTLNTIAKKPDQALLADSVKRAPEDPKQRRLMVGSLCLLLLALGVVLWHDRDFWFPDTPDADSDQPAESFPVAQQVPAQSSRVAAKPVIAAQSNPRPKHGSNHQVASVVPAPAPSTPPAPVAITSRTVLPPLEVEVVAGDSHQTLRPGSSSVRLDLQPNAPPQPTTAADTTKTVDTGTTANMTSNASERVRISPDASDIVARPVRPSYPLLARQMRVQGSVILQALISRDGIIQNLRVVSGPHILASAAQDAVRQWHFKPHLEGSEAVETEAKITVNFTISTN
jgi:protein TonB